MTAELTLDGRRLPHRAFDVILASLALVVLSVPLIVIAIAVRLSSPGPVLFRQERVGLHGRPFQIVKFRTMTVDAEQRGGQLTVGTRDPRATPVGTVLRAMKLDEMPQLWNVVRGDMRIVGPRPEVPRYVRHYTDEQRAVLTVRPGITDPASLALREESALLATAEDPERLYLETVMPHKLALNVEYLRHRSFGTDLKAIVSTLLLAVLHIGRRRPNMIEE